MIKNRFFGVVRRDQEVGKPAITGDTRFDDGTVYFEASRIPLV